MPRLVQHHAKSPVQVGDKWICQCGLSQTQPFCDGSHKATLDEKDDQLYHYDQDDHHTECTCGSTCCKLHQISVYKLRR